MDKPIEAVLKDNNGNEYSITVEIGSDAVYVCFDCNQDENTRTSLFIRVKDGKAQYGQDQDYDGEFNEIVYDSVDLIMPDEKA